MLSIKHTNTNIRRKVTLVNSKDAPMIDEDKVIQDALTTPYEKVVKIIKNAKDYLDNIKGNKQIIKDLEWALVKIQSHSLYSYEIGEGKTGDLEKLSKDNPEVKSFIGYLSNYSEEKKRKPKDKNVSKTIHLMVDPPHEMKSMNNNNLSSFAKRTKTYDVGSEKKKLDSSFDDDDFIVHDDEDERPKFLFDINCIMDQEFNLNDMVNQFGRETSFMMASRHIFERLNLMDSLEVANLDTFLNTVRKGYYYDVPYHNEMHGLDVCITFSSMMIQSNLIDVLALTNLDVMALVISALVHDLGHPGLTNLFQVNSYSDLAVIYNDVSVLENFHIAETCRILKIPSNNILCKLPQKDFKYIRKRMIECILATDMTYHAKINSILKNKLASKGIERGQNVNTLVTPQSDAFYNEQQDVLSFMIHTCDISHNSKPFNVSYEWTYKLMNEFWRQGDMEKEMKLPVSFLCDRTTADVPKSQIGFIKGIIIPTFEILVEMFPSLDYLMENVNKNLEKWADLAEGINEEKEEIKKK